MTEASAAAAAATTARSAEEVSTASAKETPLLPTFHRAGGEAEAEGEGEGEGVTIWTTRQGGSLSDRRWRRLGGCSRVTGTVLAACLLLWAMTSLEISKDDVRELARRLAESNANFHARANTRAAAAARAAALAEATTEHQETASASAVGDATGASLRASAADSRERTTTSPVTRAEYDEGDEDARDVRVCLRWSDDDNNATRESATVARRRHRRSREVGERHPGPGGGDVDGGVRGEGTPRDEGAENNSAPALDPPRVADEEAPVSRWGATICAGIAVVAIACLAWVLMCVHAEERRRERLAVHGF
jgi:hypothetical protein